MIAAGVRKFACGLSPKATTLRAQPNGEVLVTDGPYLEAKEHVGGLSILETANLDEALAWARKERQIWRYSGRGARDFLYAGPRTGLSGTATRTGAAHWARRDRISSGIAGACTSLTCSPDD